MKMFPERRRKKLSIIKQLRNCEKSRIDSEKVRFATKGHRPGAISYVLIPDRSMYSQQEQDSPIFDHFDVNSIWKRTQKQNGKDISKWERVDDIQKVTTLISGILIKHFGQSTGTPFANSYWKDRLSNPVF